MEYCCVAAQALTPPPLVVAVEMGYGHLRAADTIARAFGTRVLRMDRPPAAGLAETLLWRTAAAAYGTLSQACESPLISLVARPALEAITEIAPPPTDGIQEPPNLITRIADGLTAGFVGRRFRAMVAANRRPIIATFPAPALAGRRVAAARVFCLATDTDLNRAWAPADAGRARIEYLTPVARVVDRLRSFGVPAERIYLTGFPLPNRLVAGAEAALARRLARLDPSAGFRSRNEQIAGLGCLPEQPAEPGPIALTVAIGGAGAQRRQAGAILASLRDWVQTGRMKITLIAGTRTDVARSLHGHVRSAGLFDRLGRGIEILLSDNLDEYFCRFNECLAETDLLWTKPSELAFYAALGLPLLLAPPVGAQEHANREWLLSNGAALDVGEPVDLSQRLEGWLAEGKLCWVAENGYRRLERNGCDRIVNLVSASSQQPLSSGSE